MVEAAGITQVHPVPSPYGLLAALAFKIGYRADFVNHATRVQFNELDSLSCSFVWGNLFEVVEAAGIEPASANTLLSVLHVYLDLLSSKSVPDQQGLQTAILILV
jgi:hypothetical protein